MKSISKSKLKSQLLEFLRLVESEGEEIVVTDHGKPVVKISKYAQTPSTEDLFGEIRGKVKYFEDLIHRLNLLISFILCPHHCLL